MTYCDYGFYTGTYGGQLISEDIFPGLATRASYAVRAYTKDLSDTVKGPALETVQMATCALAEILQDEGRMTAQSYGGSLQVASESVGDWSRSYATGGVSGDKVEYLEKRKLDALKLYLGDLPEFASLFRATSYPCIHEARGYR